MIDALEMPAAAAALDGTYTIQGTISCHSDSGAVHEIHVRVPAIGKTVAIAAGDVQSLQSQPFVVQLSADIPLGGRGATNLDVTVVDTAGTSSDPKDVVVVLQ